MIATPPTQTESLYETFFTEKMKIFFKYKTHLSQRKRKL